MPRSLFAFVLVACSGPSGHSARPAPPAPSDAGAAESSPDATVPDATVPVATVPDATVPAPKDDFRALVPPKPLAQRAATPAGACVRPEREGKVKSGEVLRELALIDKAVRAKKLVPLLVEEWPVYNDRAKVGKITRGTNGERLMLVGRSGGCVPDAPIVAMNAAHEIMAIYPNYVVKRTRTVMICQASCYGGCGIAQAVQWGAEVPADAKLVPGLSIDVVIDPQIAFANASGEPCRLP